MKYTFPNPMRQLMAFAGAVVILLTAAAAADAIYVPHPGDAEQSSVTRAIWADVDAGSLTTMHRGQVHVTTVPVVYSSPDGATEGVDVWADVDAGSFITMHRGEVRGTTVRVVYSSPDDTTEGVDDIASAIEGWFQAVAEAGAIGGIPG